MTRVQLLTSIQGAIFHRMTTDTNAPSNLAAGHSAPPKISGDISAPDTTEASLRSTTVPAQAVPSTKIPQLENRLAEKIFGTGTSIPSTIDRRVSDNSTLDTKKTSVLYTRKPSRMPYTAKSPSLAQRIHRSEALCSDNTATHGRRQRCQTSTMQHTGIMLSSTTWLADNLLQAVLCITIYRLLLPRIFAPPQLCFAASRIPDFISWLSIAFLLVTLLGLFPPMVDIYRNYPEFSVICRGVLYWEFSMKAIICWLIASNLFVCFKVGLLCLLPSMRKQR